MKIEIKKIEDLKPAPYNPRKSNKKQEEKLTDSLKKFGVVEPVVYNENTGYIVGGHFRVRELKKLGYKEIECVIVNLSEEDEKELNIRLNANTGEWDWELIANEWDTQKLNEWGLDIPDFKSEEIEAVEDDYEIPQELKTDIVLGDLFEIGEHRLLCGDSTDSDQVEKLMNGQKADMVFTDPPYGIKVVGKNGKVGADNLAKNGVYAEIIGDDTTETAKEFYNTCKALGFENYIIWGGNYFTDFLPPKSCWIIWDKRGDMNSNNFADGEMAWTSFDSPVRIRKQIWSGMIKEGETGKRVHPTQKPIKLCADLINEYTKGQNVFDGFGGSGSTMVACNEINKKCFMVEMSPDYCQVILDRMIKLDPSLEIKLNGKPYFKTTK